MPIGPMVSVKHLYGRRRQTRYVRPKPKLIPPPEEKPTEGAGYYDGEPELPFHGPKIVRRKMTYQGTSVQKHLARLKNPNYRPLWHAEEPNPIVRYEREEGDVGYKPPLKPRYKYWDEKKAYAATPEGAKALTAKKGTKTVQQAWDEQQTIKQQKDHDIWPKNRKKDYGPTAADVHPPKRVAEDLKSSSSDSDTKKPDNDDASTDDGIVRSVPRHDSFAYFEPLMVPHHLRPQLLRAKNIVVGTFYYVLKTYFGYRYRDMPEQLKDIIYPQAFILPKDKWRVVPKYPDADELKGWIYLDNMDPEVWKYLDTIPKDELDVLFRRFTVRHGYNPWVDRIHAWKNAGYKFRTETFWGKRRVDKRDEYLRALRDVQLRRNAQGKDISGADYAPPLKTIKKWINHPGDEAYSDDDYRKKKQVEKYAHRAGRVGTINRFYNALERLYASPEGLVQQAKEIDDHEFDLKQAFDRKYTFKESRLGKPSRPHREEPIYTQQELAKTNFRYKAYAKVNKLPFDGSVKGALPGDFTGLAKEAKERAEKLQGFRDDSVRIGKRMEGNTESKGAAARGDSTRRARPAKEKAQGSSDSRNASARPPKGILKSSVPKGKAQGGLSGTARKPTERAEGPSGYWENSPGPPKRMERYSEPKGTARSALAQTAKPAQEKGQGMCYYPEDSIKPPKRMEGNAESKGGAARGDSTGRARQAKERAQESSDSRDASARPPKGLLKSSVSKAKAQGGLSGTGGTLGVPGNAARLAKRMREHPEDFSTPTAPAQEKSESKRLVPVDSTGTSKHAKERAETIRRFQDSSTRLTKRMEKMAERKVSRNPNRPPQQGTEENEEDPEEMVPYTQPKTLLQMYRYDRRVLRKVTDHSKIAQRWVTATRRISPTLLGRLRKYAKTKLEPTRGLRFNSKRLKRRIKGLFTIDPVTGTYQKADDYPRNRRELKAKLAIDRRKPFYFGRVNKHERYFQGMAETVHHNFLDQKHLFTIGDFLEGEQVRQKFWDRGNLQSRYDRHRVNDELHRFDWAHDPSMDNIVSVKVGMPGRNPVETFGKTSFYGDPKNDPVYFTDHYDTHGNLLPNPKTRPPNIFKEKKKDPHPADWNTGEDQDSASPPLTNNEQPQAPNGPSPSSSGSGSAPSNSITSSQEFENYLKGWEREGQRLRDRNKPIGDRMYDIIYKNARQTLLMVPKRPAPIYVDDRIGTKHNYCKSGLANVYVHKEDFGKIPEYLKQRNIEQGRPPIPDFRKFYRAQYCRYILGIQHCQACGGKRHYHGRCKCPKGQGEEEGDME